MGIYFSEVPLDQVVAAAKTDPHDDSPAMNEIVKRFHGLAYKIAGSVVGHRVDLLDDVANAGMYAVVAAVRKHKGTTGYVAYFKSYMVGAASRSFKKLKGRYTVPLDSPEAAAAMAKLMAPEDVSGWGDGEVADAVASLTSTQQALLWRRHGLVYTLAEIAAVKNVTVSAVSQQLAVLHSEVAAKVA